MALSRSGGDGACGNVGSAPCVGCPWGTGNGRGGRFDAAPS